MISDVVTDLPVAGEKAGRVDAVAEYGVVFGCIVSPAWVAGLFVLGQGVVSRGPCNCDERGVLKCTVGTGVGTGLAGAGYLRVGVLGF